MPITKTNSLERRTSHPCFLRPPSLFAGGKSTILGRPRGLYRHPVCKMRGRDPFSSHLCPSFLLSQLNAALRGKDAVHDRAEIAEWREVALLLGRAMAKLESLCVALYRGLDCRVSEVPARALQYTTHRSKDVTLPAHSLLGSLLRHHPISSQSSPVML